MAEDSKAVCENCIYFSHGLSEKGYCKLYHHNIRVPERVCSRYEPKQKNDTETKLNDAKINKQTPKGLKKSNNQYIRRLTYSVGIVCSFIMIVALLLIDIVFAVELHPHPIALPVKIGTLSVVLALFLFLSWHTLMLLRKHRWFYIIYLIISMALVLLVILDFDNVWLRLSNSLNDVIEYIFYGLHKG